MEIQKWSRNKGASGYLWTTEVKVQPLRPPALSPRPQTEGSPAQRDRSSFSASRVRL